MTYESPQALRMALEQRLLNQSRETGISLDRLRRRVIFERIIARLHHAEPGRWVLKGGMAMEVRLRDRARLTKDIDLGLRDDVTEQEALHERIVEALTEDPFVDGFVLRAGSVSKLMEDGAGHLTWRSKVEALLGGKLFGSVQLDISPRSHELKDTDQVPLPNSLEFADVRSTTIEIIDVNRHAAEKLHAIQKDFGDRENSRVRDLVDLMIFLEYELLREAALMEAIVRVWHEREGNRPSGQLRPVPVNWAERYEALAAEHDVQPRSFTEATAKASELWTRLFSDDPTDGHPS